MTTKVHIVNFGPNKIRVEPGDDNLERTQQSEALGKELAAQEATNLYVHSHQTIRVYELSS